MPHRILIVDDEPLIQRTLERVLTRAGREPHAVGTAGEALAWLQHHEVDAAIVDLDLGDHDGLSVLRYLRDTQPTAVRILMTGHDDLPLVVDAINRGQAVAVLRKPFDHEALLRLLDDGRARVEDLARASMSHRVHQLVQERALIDRLEPAHLRFALQPIVAVDRTAVLGHEALLRPNHPAWAGPLDLLLAVERHGRVCELGRLLLALAVPTVTRCEGLLFLNLHPAQLGAPTRFFESLEPLLPVADRIVLEITERSRLQDHAEWERSVEGIRERGFQLAIDDLGAGFSALSMLADLRPGFIKLDHSLVRGSPGSNRKQRLIQLLATFGEATGATVIAEGVESEDELKAMIDCGVDWVQGFLMGTPQLLLDSSP